MADAMTHKERFFAMVSGRPVDRAAFFPDISDWYSAARTLPGRPRRGGSGALTGDDASVRTEVVLPADDDVV